MQTASPDRGVVGGAALIVGLEPDRGFAEPIEIGTAADVATQVGEEKTVGLLFFGDGVVPMPELEHAIIEDSPVGGAIGRWKLTADGTMAIGKAADGWPSVGVEAVHVVERIDFAHDRRNVIVHVTGKHAGVEQAWIFRPEQYRTVTGAHRPLRVGFECVAPIQVRTHARDDSHAALPGGSHAFPKKVTAVQELSVTVKLHLGRIERQDTRHADEDDVRAGRVPVLRPLLDIHHCRIVFRHVALADAANCLLPWQRGWIDGSQTSRQRNEFRSGPSCRHISDRLRGAQVGIE